MTAWRLDVQIAAGNEDDAARPVWGHGVPYCDLKCPHRGAYGCTLTGQRHMVCEPVVKAMGVMLSAGPK